MFGLVPAAAQERCQSDVGRIVSAQGRIELRESETAPWVVTKLDDRLCRGDTIRVGERGRAAIRLINDAVIRLDQNTTLQLISVVPPESEETSLFSLVLGAIQSFSRKPRKLSFRTPYLNATIEGTELAVRVGADRADVALAEGRVLAENAGKSETINSGEAVTGRPGAPPSRQVGVRARDAAQWALFYPPVLAGGGGDGAIAAIAKSLEVGRVDEARSAIDRLLGRDPNTALAYSLRSVIRVVQNDTEGALADASRGVELAPTSAAAKIALSYALQARFDLPGAREAARKAVADEPQNALAHARLAELDLSFGDRAAARRTAARASGLAPNLARAQIVTGFAALAEFRTADAKAAFNRAISLDSSDPLPRLGLGLSKIREGDLAGGRADLEVAVALDSLNAIFRAYLGKAYFEERRPPLDADQFAIAKELDPFDPTAYYYNAISLQAGNRPIEAIREFEASIARNDNRAVYRSRLLLDQDRAARSATLARALNESGLSRLALLEAARSLALDPSNASAHRMMTDGLAGYRRRETPRVSELYQAQMFQGTNINPLPASLSETNLNISAGGGPTTAGMNEFTPLFERNQVQLDVTAEGGNHGTLGGEAIASAVHDWFSISASAFGYTTEGFRDNHDIQHKIYNLFAQAAVTPELNLQVEGRKRDSESGDLEQSFSRSSFDSTLKRDLEVQSGRVGGRWSPSPSTDVLASFIASGRDEMKTSYSTDPTFGRLDTLAETNDDAYQGDALYVYKMPGFNVTAGVSASHVDRDTLISIKHGSVFLGFPPFCVPPGCIFPPAVPGDNFIAPTMLTETFDHQRGFVYVNTAMPASVIWTIGGTVEHYVHDLGMRDYDLTTGNYKFGVQWAVTDDLNVRGAVLRVLKPVIAADRVLEPSNVAGVNQYYDDANGTIARIYGLGADLRVMPNLWFGADATFREIKEPIVDTSTTSVVRENRNEVVLSGEANWAPTDRIMTSYKVFYDHFTTIAGSSVSDIPKDLETWIAPAAIRYSDPCGFFADASATYVHQDLTRIPGSTKPEGVSEFVTLDFGLGFRIPGGRGVIALQVKNVLDTDFKYQDDSFREFSDEDAAGPFFSGTTYLVSGRYVF